MTILDPCSICLLPFPSFPPVLGSFWKYSSGSRSCSKNFHLLFFIIKLNKKRNDHQNHFQPDTATKFICIYWYRCGRFTLGPIDITMFYTKEVFKRVQIELRSERMCPHPFLVVKTCQIKNKTKPSLHYGSQGLSCWENVFGGSHVCRQKESWSSPLIRHIRQGKLTLLLKSRVMVLYTIINSLGYPPCVYRYAPSSLTELGHAGHLSPCKALP